MLIVCTVWAEQLLETCKFIHPALVSFPWQLSNDIFLSLSNGFPRDGKNPKVLLRLADLTLRFQEETPQPPWCKAAGLAFISFLLLLFHSRCRQLILIRERQSVDLLECLVLGRSRPLSLPPRSHQLWGTTQYSFNLIPGVVSESKADGD